MPAFLTQFPFFKLVKTDHEALTVVDTIACFATVEEREHLIPQIIRLTHDIKHRQQEWTLTEGLNNLLAGYLALYGEFSDRLTIMIGEDLHNEAVKKAQQDTCSAAVA